MAQVAGNELALLGFSRVEWSAGMVCFRFQGEGEDVDNAHGQSYCLGITDGI